VLEWKIGEEHHRVGVEVEGQERLPRTVVVVVRLPRTVAAGGEEEEPEVGEEEEEQRVELGRFQWAAVRVEVAEVQR
jgi:hypothetical protein